MPAALAAMALAAAVLSPAVGASSSSLHPKGLSASLVDGTVTLSWNAPVDDAGSVTGYQILRRRPGVDAVGTFHVIAADTATADVSFVDRCADQPGTAYTYRVKARRGDQLSRWGNYSRIDLAAGYVPGDPQTGCDPDTGTGGFQDRSALPGLPSSYPNALGFADPDPQTADVIADFTYEHFQPRDVTAKLTDDGIVISWRWPSQQDACASYDIERVPGTRTLKKVTHPSGHNTWEVTETGAYYEYTCTDRRNLTGFEIYRTSFGHVHRGGGTVELLSDSQPYSIDIGRHAAYTDRSRDAVVGPRSHNYQVRALYGSVNSLDPDRDFGSRLSEGAFIHR
ncbi:fibronectin type III domain-containing protein [Candidatus Poriferisodalis sp.]|uniref:fibronectin type III domain-containing protein n=1 Tax=Candidatus Poriferisodalis sp. TaxID=3101277 RepID=UPI003C70306F